MSNDDALEELLSIIETKPQELPKTRSNIAKAKLANSNYSFMFEDAKANTAHSEPVDASFAPVPPDMSWISIDLETGGFSPKTADIVEIGIVYYKGMEFLKTQNYLIKPHRWNHEAAKTHKIKKEDCDTFGVSIEDAMHYMFKVVSKSNFVVAFNADFENKFLKHYFESHEIEAPFIDWVDPFKIAQAAGIRGKSDKQNLGALCEHFGVDLLDAHRAVDDAKATSELLFKMLHLLRRDVRDIMRERGVLNISKYSQDDRAMDAVFSGLQRNY